MLNQEDYEYLKDLPYLDNTQSILALPKVWYASEEKVVFVARILDNHGIFTSTDDSPRKWTKAIQGLIREYEKEMVNV